MSEQFATLCSDVSSKDKVEETTGMIFDIAKFSTHDGPGIRTVVFLKGCPLRCWWCHNPEGQVPSQQMVYTKEKCLRCFSCVKVCPNHAIKILHNTPVLLMENCKLSGKCVDACQTKAREIAGRRVKVDDVITEIEKDRIFYDESAGGITFSGGEPFLQPIFLQSLLQTSKERGIHTAVETCGFVDTEILLRASRDVDLYLFDLKAIDNEIHRKFTGVPNDVILTNLKQLSKIHDHVIIRFPVIPGVNDDEDAVCKLGEFASSLSGVREIDVLPYHPLGTEKYNRVGVVSRMPKIDPPSKAKIDSIAKELERFVSYVKIGG